jgi:hypothetical protein
MTMLNLVAVCVWALLIDESRAAEGTAFLIQPAEVRLAGNFSRAQLLVTATGTDGKTNDRSPDLTSRAVYTSTNPQVVSVDASGRLLAVGNGQAEITVTVDGQVDKVTVTVAGVTEKPVVDFVGHIGPILSKAGCNMGSCHASQHGKGGFKLSVFGFDAAADRVAIIRDHAGRRVNFLDPSESLFLKKPTMRVPHGGSQRLTTRSIDYRILTAWIAAGAPGPRRGALKVTGLTVVPTQRVGGQKMTQQLRVEATYSDGSIADVTAWAKFDSMDDGVLSVTRQGMVSASGKGQATVMVRFEGVAEISTFVVPYADSIPLAGWKSNNLIDELAADKFRELGIEPSPLCDDATFVRRAFFDAIGTLPPINVVLAFLDSDNPDKRAKLVDRLLGLTGDRKLDVYNDQYAAFWTLKWSDLIRNNSNSVGEQGMWSLHNWIRESFRTNKPFDRFVRELVTAKGSIYSNGPANYFRINGNSSDLAESTAQLFLGVRLQCAKCHHHPFEKYSQADYQGFGAFFSRVRTKNSEEFGLFGRESVVVVDPRPVKATPLGGETLEHPLDIRIPLGAWLTSPENSLFARSVVNRYLGYMLGQGVVEPIDDMRDTNPPTNAALLDALANDFVSNGHDLKQLIRTIMTSRLYQLDSQPTAANAADRKFFSHFKVKRLAAEPLLDAVDAACGTQTKFKSLPPGTRAIELPDAEYPNYFLKTFGKPKRASVCECERTPDANLAQALHTLNGDILAAKIADKNGRVAKLLAAKKSHAEIVEELYLASVSRLPSQAEVAATKELLAESPSPKEFYADLLWALLNSKQFLFVR